MLNVNYFFKLAKNCERILFFQAKTVKDTGSLTDFFNLQDKIFIVIISATLFVLSIFFVIGYNLYKGKYRK